jgi:nitroreductase
MIRFAPSALNLQPWKINVVTDQKVKEELNPAAFNQEQVTICSHLFVFCGGGTRWLTEKMGYCCLSGILVVFHSENWQSVGEGPSRPDASPLK